MKRDEWQAVHNEVWKRLPASVRRIYMKHYREVLAERHAPKDD